MVQSPQQQQSQSVSSLGAFDAEDPRRAFADVQRRIDEYRARGNPVPEDLKRLHRQLGTECAAMSQGR